VARAAHEGAKVSLLQRWQRLSLRSQLMVGILAPVLLLVLFNSTVLYRQALRAADIAYDRTLLATAKSIGEQLEIVGRGDTVRVRATLPYSALEPFEADNRSRMFYRVSGFQGEMVSGFEDLPIWRGHLPTKSLYAALVDFYDGSFRGEAVRVAVLLQPVSGAGGQGMATIQVAETLELRQTLARQILVDTLWRQALLLAVIAGVVVLVVQAATRPVRQISAALTARSESDLAPLQAEAAPPELRPLVEATNHHMGRLAHLLEHQKRFVRDTAHQLRTPLAVLKTQVQSARRGDLAPAQALGEIEHTVDRATELANQMLALAKVEQLRQQSDAPVLDWDRVVREVALDLAPLMAERQLDFALDTRPAPVRAHQWALRELARNLLHNAIRHIPEGAALHITLVTDDRTAALTVADSGPGIPDSLRPHLFEPFSRHQHPGALPGGSGLGLAICQEIARTLGGTLNLDNRLQQGRVVGLDAVVRLPLAQAEEPPANP
jgi:two-component system sensor histidine kinase TctE